MTVSTVHEGFVERLVYTEFPPQRWRRIRMNNGIERINRETRMRTRLKYIVERGWNKWEWLDMSKLEEMNELKGKEESQKRTEPRPANQFPNES